MNDGTKPLDHPQQDLPPRRPPSGAYEMARSRGDLHPVVDRPKKRRRVPF